MPAKKKRPRPPRKRWSLFWVTTEDGSEDCFVVAHSARSAAGFFEGNEGYDPGDADAEHIADLPDELQSATGWREAPSSDVVQGADYAPDALIVACGGEIDPIGILTASRRTSRETCLVCGCSGEIPADLIATPVCSGF